MGAIEALMTRDFLIAALAAIAAAAVVFTVGFTFLGRGGVTVKQRIKRVALEREKMRAEEMSRLRGRGQGEEQQTRTARRAAGRQSIQNVVERFSLQKAFADENTGDALARAGLRGQGPLNAYVFARFVTPFFLFVLAFVYLQFTVFADKPPYLNAI
jgi:tight adherence protein C